MSNLGKIVVIGAIGVVGYYTFIKKESIPGVNTITETTRGVMQEANKDYVDHKTHSEAEYMDRNATVLQDDSSMRAMTNK